MSNPKEIVEGHRKAVVEHIEKYKKYPHPQDKEFALKTVNRVQDEISKIKQKNPKIENSWEDTWKP